MEKKYLTLSAHLKDKFGERVQRVPLDAGFSCPNRLGGRKSSGCIYCDNTGSAAPWINEKTDISTQFQTGAAIAAKRYNARKYIAYFQSYTGSNAPIEKLQSIYNEAISFPGVVGLAISTRPDCLADDVLDLLSDLSKRTYVWVEIGAQSMNEKTLQWIKRGHTAADFKNAVARLRSRSIEAVGHIIFGLPCETKDEMLRSYKDFIDTGIDGVKIHSLHIIKGTELASMYEKERFELLEMEEYIDLVRQALQITPCSVVIHRLTGEVAADKLVAPLWVLNKNEIIRRISE
jgi:uncharacterized protein